MQKTILKTKGRDSKIRLMKSFEGIGDKYARNIFMDMYHVDFVYAIAIDGGILEIAKALEIGPSLSYDELEKIFVELAKEIEITPWHLDRLLYIFKDYYLKKINNGV